MTVPVYSPAEAVLLDGTGRDKAWKRARRLPPLRLPAEYGCKPFQESHASVVRAGRWLLVGLDAAETEGLVARESMHGVDLWREDAFAVDLKGARPLRVVANPLGTVCCYRGGRSTMRPIAGRTVQAAARADGKGWRVELAVDLHELLGERSGAGKVEFRVSRQRQARGLVPFEESATPPSDAPPAVLLVGSGWRGAGRVRLDVAAPQRFTKCAALEAGLLDRLPASDKQWARMPAVLLQSEDGQPIVDLAFQPTEVRAAATRDHLALLVKCMEAHPSSIDDRGLALWQEDGVEVFLGPVGFNYLQLLTNPKGVLKAARGKTGGRRIREIMPPKGVAVRARKTGRRSWTVELTAAFRVVQDFVGAPAELLPAVHPWRIQVVRNRPARDALGQGAQVSVLNVTHSGNAHCPARFGLVRIVRPSGKPIACPAIGAVELPPPVLDAARRKALGAARLLQRWIDGRAERLHRNYEEGFRKIHDAGGWRRHASRVRANLAKAMFPATRGRMPARGELHGKIVYDLPGEGFRCRGVVFQGRAGLPVPATLYVPAARAEGAGGKRPALVMVPAHHTGRNSRDLAILGANFARAGGVAMAVESVGSGERAVAAPWAHKNHQRNLFGGQVFLAGDNPAGWTALEISRAIDYLLDRGGVDADRIAIVGGVAGGGDVSALAAALDERIDVSIPFNFSTTEPMDAWYDPLRSYYGAHAGGLTAWAVAALAAPRKLIQAEEFAWTDERKRSYGRFERVYGWLGEGGNLARLHGGPNTHATHFAGLHRVQICAVLNRWFRMGLPTEQADEFTDIPEPGRLDCFEKPVGRTYLSGLRRAGRLLEPHQLAARIARRRLADARRACLRDAKRRAVPLGRAIADRLTRLLGETAPAKLPDEVTPLDLGRWRGAAVQGVWLPAEAPGGDLGLAVWVLLPRSKGKRAAVVGICRSGKARFLARRGGGVQRLLKAGIAVCLVDLRGCGETSPGGSRLPDGPSATLAYRLWSLNDSLPMRQLRDVRTALAYLAARDDIDPARLGLWGEGFSRPNAPAGGPILFDEVGFRQASPVPKEQVEPLGGLLAMLAGLWPIETDAGRGQVKAVLARGTLVSCLSVLERRYHYVPADAIIPGLLRVTDVPEIASALRSAGVRLCAEDLRDGSNRPVEAEQVGEVWGAAAPAGYSRQPSDRGVEVLIRALRGKTK